MRRAVKEKVLSRAELLAALGKTYDDSMFVLGQGIEFGGDYRKGLQRTLTIHVSKLTLERIIEASPFEAFSAIPGHAKCLALDKQVYLYTATVDENLIFETQLPAGESWDHVTVPWNCHYEMFFNIDHKKKTISFRLGQLERTLGLVEYSGYCWKPTKERLYCNTSEKLEHDFLGDWVTMAIAVGRRVLGVKSLI